MDNEKYELSKSDIPQIMGIQPTPTKTWTETRVNKTDNIVFEGSGKLKNNACESIPENLNKDEEKQTQYSELFTPNCENMNFSKRIN